MPVRRLIRTLLPMACDGKGPSATCLHLMNGAVRGGHPAEIFAVRRRLPGQDVPMVLSLPGPLSMLPYGRVSKTAEARIERQYLDTIGGNDIAYLWPSASLEVHKTLKDRGIPVVLEGINTRMKSAKRILDAAYEAFGIAPAHAITEARIAEEEEKYRHADAIFAPNREVERAMAGSPLEERIIPASYGAAADRGAPRAEYPQKDSLTILFVGTVCVRKGAHHLLEAFAGMKGDHRLRLLGQIEPAIRERYGDLIASGRVEWPGFVDDPHPEFAAADIFVMPSLEEGGPQVTYEAATHGMPIVASPMGMGRLGEHEGAMTVVDPSDVPAFRDALERLVRDRALRERLGRRAYELSALYDWDRIGAERATSLQAVFPVGSSPSAVFESPLHEGLSK